MPTVRFVAAHLAYGCHTRDFELPEAERPIVVHGPNGSGKSTFLEGLVRTPFGFDRRRGDDGRIHETRRPWSGATYSGRVRIACLDGTERWIERDFDSAEVRILVDDRETWQGDGNPGGTNQEAVDYRRRLREMFGLAELAEYERTACAHQGQLVRTRLGDELIQAASGGGVDIDEAREAIRARYRKLTLQPIVVGGRAANKRRELERSLDRIDDLAARLEAVRRAEQERLPLIREESRLLATIAELDRRIERLEDAWEKVSSRKGQQAEKRAAEARLRSLERLERELTAATRAVTSVEQIHQSLADRSAYPDDFVERAATARRLQEEHRRLRRERDRLRATLADQTRSVAWPLVAAAATLAMAALLAWMGSWVPAGVVAGLVVLGAALVAGRCLKRRTERKGALRQVEDSLGEVGERIESSLDGVPHVDDPTEFDLEAALDRFQTREATGRELRSARQHLQEVVSDARSELRHAYGDLPRDPGGLLELLHRAIGEHRDRLATVELWLDQATAPDLPEGISAIPADVQAALDEARAERKAREDELGRVREDLQERGRPETSGAALERELGALRERTRELERRTTVLRRAYLLIDDAYGQFRDNDQKRLMGLVSRHLETISRGRLGPLDDTADLAQARIRSFQREAPLRYRPLSYGELHAALLAVRLGAADFLARAGIRVPLIIDEPFANLDDEHDESVWESLGDIARERQVIITTQEGRTLARLGIEPDIELERPAVEARDG